MVRTIQIRLVGTVRMGNLLGVGYRSKIVSNNMNKELQISEAMTQKLRYSILASTLLYTHF